MRYSAAFVAALLVGNLALTTVGLIAHEIPNDVTIQAFVKPEGQTLRLILRAPLQAMRDVDVPMRSPQYVDLVRLRPLAPDMATLWLGDNVSVFEDDEKLPYPRVASVRLSLASDPSFQSYESALAHVTGPELADSTEFVWSQGFIDVLFEFPIESDRSKFSIDPRFARLGIRTITVVRFLPPGGAVRAFELAGDPGLIHLDPSWFQAAASFVEMGFFHILDGADHLLFLFCLVIPFRRFRALVPVVTAFTVAHSITLIASAYDLAPNVLWFPPLIETLIATSIVYMALENIVQVGLKRRWMITFAFGLVHGFGFSFALRQTLQFAGSHLLTSLLSFNVGVELGQLLVLVLMIPSLELLFRFVVAERIGTVILSGVIAHTGWHWMIDRYDRLRQYRFEWPTLDLVFLLAAVRWALVLVVLAACFWLISTFLRQPSRRPAEPGDTPIAAEE